MRRARPIVRGVLVCGSLAALASCGARTYEQSYAGYTNSWFFRARYPAVDRLFNAFDYRSRDAVGDAAPTSDGRRAATGGTGLPEVDLRSPPQSPATAARGARRRSEIRHLVPRGRRDVRVGAHVPSPGLRHHRLRAVLHRAERPAYQGRAAQLSLAAGSRAERGTEVHGADGGPAVLAGVPPIGAEVQRPDLVVPLAPDGGLRCDARGAGSAIASR